MNTVIELAKKIISEKILPPIAIDEALHISIAFIHNVDFLLTWNCRHIDNALIKPLIRNLVVLNGYQYSEICTPQELMGE